jgi:hypothetical protein
MKNVAATSGQSVSLATAFLVEGNTWEGTCAGSDTVLNFFLSSSYKRSSLSLFRKASARFEEYKVCARAQEKNARKQKKFCANNCTSGRLSRRFARRLVPLSGKLAFNSAAARRRRIERTRLAC